MARLIQIVRDDTKVSVQIEDGPLGSIYHFTYDCGNRWYAQLLTDHFNKKLSTLIEGIRTDEYNAGYKDGRAKRAKRTWFDCFLRR